MRKKKGQLLVVTLLLLLILATIIPVMVLYVQSEARWSVKQGQNTNAFQLAEAAVDRGYQKITESTTTWGSVQAGQQLSGFHLDTAYTDLSGGSYAISVTSGPGLQTATIIGIGRDKNLKEVRALQVIFTNSLVSGNTGIAAANGVLMSGSNVEVEWGSIMSPKSITIGSKVHPSYWSAGSIDLDANGPTPPNCDAPSCWWWHSYNSQIPPIPSIDFGFYQSSAAASGTSPCGKAYYINGSTSGGCSDHTGHSFYITGNWTSFDGDIVGNVIVLGNLSFRNGSLSTLSSYPATVPPQAWQQYCHDWGSYQAYDANANGKPPCFGSLNNTYRASNVTYAVSPAVHGLMYIGGNLTLPNGGGNSDILHGVIIVQGTADITTNSHGHIYYDPAFASNIQTTIILLSRQSWKDIVQPWPGGLP